MIDRTTIDRIRDATSITAVIGEVVKLRRQGRNQVGLCPFHQEKTPSFVVHEEQAFFHCFGCGASGDVFAFLEQHEGLSFIEAVRRLADRAGIELELSAADGQRGAEEELRRQRQQQYDAAQAAAAFYERMLQEHPLGALAREELERRRLVPSAPPDPVAAALSAFRIGYAPYGWQALGEHLTQSGIHLGVAQQLGLLVPRSSGRSHTDTFRHRLVFPILDLHGRVVAFIGRALPEPSQQQLSHAGLEPMELMRRADATVAYLGCPESLIYRPRQLVFGLHQARQSLRSEDRCILVRSVFEVLSLHAHQIQSAVATLGPGLTLEQALLLRRFCQQVNLLRGADSAGQRAVFASQQICRQAGLLVKVAVLPGGVDADELLGAQGAETLRQMFGAARGLLEYWIDRSLDSRFLTDDVATRAAKLQRLGALLGGEPDPLVRALAQQYANSVVARLGVEGTTTLRGLGAVVERALRRAGPLTASGSHPAPTSAASATVDRAEQVGREILGAVLDYPQLFADSTVAEQLGILEGDVAAAVAAARCSWDGKHGIELDAFISRLAPGIAGFAERRMLAPVHPSEQEARGVLLRHLSWIAARKRRSLDEVSVQNDPE